MSLQEKIRQEKEQSDSGTVWVQSSKLRSRFYHVFSCPNTFRGENYFDELIKEKSKDAIVLDYGCYNGCLAPKFHKYGAKKIIGIDISQKGVTEAKKSFGHIAEFHCMDAHKTSFEDDTFDFIVGRAILHHLEFKVALKEINRILKPGGHALFYEPLRDNPFAKLIRYLTPQARTKDEQPLSKEQILWANGLFDNCSHKYLNLFSVPCGMLSSLIFDKPDNWLMELCDYTDLYISRTPFRYWMRFCVLHWRKN